MSSVIVDKVESGPEEEARLERIKKKPDVTECFNLMDFEVLFPSLGYVHSVDNRPWRDK